MPSPKKPKLTPFPEIRKQLERDEFMQLLSGTTLFRKIPYDKLSLATLEEIWFRGDVISLNRRRTLEVAEEDLNKAFIYEIVSGYVKIYDRRLSKSEKRTGSLKNPPALLAWRVPGELLGDFQFALPEERLQDHMVATDDCRLLKLPVSLVQKVAQSHPQIYLNVASNITSKAINARIRAQILRLPNMKTMVAQLFLELIAERRFDSGFPGKYVLNGTFHIADIANFLGYKPRRTQSEIHKLIEEGFIDHHKSQWSGRFEILDQEGLVEFVKQELRKPSTQNSKRAGK